MNNLLLVLSLVLSPLIGVEEMPTTYPLDKLPEIIREELEGAYPGDEFNEELILQEIRSIDPNFSWENLTTPLPADYDEYIKEWQEITQDYERVVSGEIKDQILDSIKKLAAGEEDIGKVFLFGNPMTDGIIIDDIFSITEMAVGKTSLRGDGSEDIEKLVIRGMGPPDSTVFLFIYSTPIVVSAKTNQEGRWTYVLDKELEDGNHEIYVATADETGKIIAKNTPLPFVKEAASIKTSLTYFSEEEVNLLSFFEGRLFSILAIVFLLIIVAAIIFVGMIIDKK